MGVHVSPIRGLRVMMKVRPLLFQSDDFFSWEIIDRSLSMPENVSVIVGV